MPQQSDAFWQFLSIVSPVFTALIGLIAWLVKHQASNLATQVAELEKRLTGEDGMYLRIENLRGRMTTAEANIDALKGDTLSREVFERETYAQNSRLDDIRNEQVRVARKVESIDRNVARGYLRPEEPTSDSPPPVVPPRPLPAIRPKMPSRPR